MNSRCEELTDRFAPYYAARRLRAAEALRDRGMDLLICAGRHSLAYLGAQQDLPWLLVTVDGDVRGTSEPELLELLPTLGSVRIAAELCQLSAANLLTLQRRLANGQTIMPGDDTVSQLRMQKDQLEVALLRRAARVTAHSMRMATHLIEPGVSEVTVAHAFETATLAQRCQLLAFDTSVAFGARTAAVWSRPTLRRAEPGDPYVIDAGAVYGGYVADMARSGVVGSGTHPAGALDLVNRVRDEVLRHIEVGIPARHVAQLAERRLSALGAAHPMPHHLGHGVGLALHEAPIISLRSTDLLLPGAVFALEPAYYVPGAFGCRIEDLFLLDETGVSPLACATTPAPYEAEPLNPEASGRLPAKEPLES